MVKVITYGTYDMLHYGHIRLLERAKALGDYLIVGVTSDDFDRQRGKINVQQSLEERIAAIQATGLADKVVIEEYEGQKIDDIKKYGVDIFTVGSDWKGKFDYLEEYCKVVYLDRTEGVSSTEIRTQNNHLAFGIVGSSNYVNKLVHECSFVNGIELKGIYTERDNELAKDIKTQYNIFYDYEELLAQCDAVFVHAFPQNHYDLIKKALNAGKHVLCESPLTLSTDQTNELLELAGEKKLILMEVLRTAFSMAFSRMMLLIKSGRIGNVVSIDATCTSLRNYTDKTDFTRQWSSMTDWGPTAFLPIFNILGSDYQKTIATHIIDKKTKFDTFSRISFTYPNAVASVKVGTGVKSEGELIISGTRGYIYVPAPWWKTDYFEIRYEHPEDNRRYFYQLDGEGIRYELVSFIQAVEKGTYIPAISKEVTMTISKMMEDYYAGKDVIEI